MALSLKKQFLSLTLLLTISSSVSATQCDINFNHAVVIDPEHIRIQNDGLTFLQINNDQQLFVEGREISLSNKQAELIIQYALGIRQQIPEIVSIAIEGVDVGLKAVNKVIAGLTGENSASHQKLQKHFDELQWRLRKRFNHSDNSFFIAPQDFDDFDQIFAGAFEQEIEALVSESIGTILLAVGDAMTNPENTNSEQRVTTFDERMKDMGEELELEISSKVNALEAKAKLFCQKLQALDHVESQLSQNISALSEYNLIQQN